MKTPLLCIAALTCCLTTFAFPSYEPFADATASGGTAYNAGDNLSGQTNVLAENWNPIASTVSGPAVNLAGGSLTAPTGLPSSKGNKVQLFNQVGPGARYNIPPTNSGTLFYSVLIQLKDIS